MLNRLLKLILAFVCYVLIAQTITANNNWHYSIESDDEIVSYDSAFVLYKVHTGDYISKVAKEFGVPVADIMRANNLISAHATLYIGQILRIPTRGRTNEILREREKRLLLSSDTKLVEKEEIVRSIDGRLARLSYGIDSIKLKIKELEQREVLDQSIDEDNMGAMLRQMNIAKEIGRRKKELVDNLKKKEFEFLLAKKDLADSQDEIDRIQTAIDRKVLDINSKTVGEVDFDISSLNKNNTTIVAESSDLANVQKESAKTTQIVTKVERTEQTIKKDPISKIESDYSVKGHQTISDSKPKLEEKEIPKPKPQVQPERKVIVKRYDESKNPVSVNSLEEKYEKKIYRTQQMHSDTYRPDNEVAKDKVVELKKASEDFKSQVNPSTEILKTKGLKDNVIRGSYEYDRRELFKGLKDVDIASELDSINRIKAKFFLSRALKEIDRHQYKKAKKYISKSLKHSENFLDAKVLLADLNATFGYNDKAIKLYDQAIEQNQSIAQLYYNRAHCYLKDENNQNAFSDFTAAIELNEEYLLAYAGRASISIDINDFEAAISDYTNILSYNNYFIPAYKGRGIAFMETGEYEKAINDFNITLELSPREPVIYHQRGLAKILTNKLFEACFDLWTAAELGYKEAEKSIKRYCD